MRPPIGRAAAPPSDLQEYEFIDTTVSPTASDPDEDPPIPDVQVRRLALGY